MKRKDFEGTLIHSTIKSQIFISNFRDEWTSKASFKIRINCMGDSHHFEVSRVGSHCGAYIR